MTIIDSNMKRSFLVKSYIKETVFRDIDFTEATFKEATFERVVFENCTLGNTNFENITDFRQIEFHNNKVLIANTEKIFSDLEMKLLLMGNF